MSTPRTRERRFTAADETTGEVRSYVEQIEYVPRAKSRDPYVILFMDGIDQLIDAHLTAREYRLWFELVRRARVNDTFDVTHSSLAAHTGLDPSNVSRGISKLIAKGLIVRPARSTYALNPKVAWRGSAPLREAALEEGEK